MFIFVNSDKDNDENCDLPGSSYGNADILQRQKDLTIFPAGCELKTGDIVFRRGGGISSHAVMMADRNGRYSHVGIVVDSAGKKMIVHAVPDEPDFKGDPDRVKMETPEKFFSPINANAGEVKRLKGDTIIPLKAAEYAMQTYRRNTLFDHDYDDSDTTKMYCCELVEFAYAKAGLTLAGTERHDISLPGMKKIRCMLPSDICNNKSLKRLLHFKPIINKQKIFEP